VEKAAFPLPLSYRKSARENRVKINGSRRIRRFSYWKDELALSRLAKCGKIVYMGVGSVSF
jgi:hypothetical protein